MLGAMLRSGPLSSHGWGAWRAAPVISKFAQAAAAGVLVLFLGALGTAETAMAQAPLHDDVTIHFSDRFTNEGGEECFNVHWSYTAPTDWETAGRIVGATFSRYLTTPPVGDTNTPVVLDVYALELPNPGVNTYTLDPPVEDCPTPGVWWTYSLAMTLANGSIQALLNDPATANRRIVDAPTPPVNVKVDFGVIRNLISWRRVPNGVGLTTSGYRVWRASRADAADIDWTLLHTVRSPWITSYVHDVRPGQPTEHYYRLVTVTSEGDSTESIVVGGPTLTAADLLDLNEVDQLDGNDLQILYFAYGFRDLLGMGSDEAAGFVALRQAVLGGLSGNLGQPVTEPTDESLRAFLTKANDLRRNIDALEFDVNRSGAVTQDDALILHYAHTMATELGDGQNGGTEDFRRTFLGPLAVSRDPSDADLQMLLQRANALLGN